MPVLLCKDINPSSLPTLLERYDLSVEWVNDEAPIPGSFWQPPEAGLVGSTLYIRNDTPVHSALHESSHYICMDQKRREHLHTDAGGTAIEESGVCYLQILLSDHLAEMGKARMLSDMDEWGYSYRLGSSRAWFEQDAEDAYQWLLDNKLITEDSTPTWHVR